MADDLITISKVPVKIIIRCSSLVILCNAYIYIAVCFIELSRLKRYFVYVDKAT